MDDDKTGQRTEKEMKEGKRTKDDKAGIICFHSQRDRSVPPAVQRMEKNKESRSEGYVPGPVLKEELCFSKGSIPGVSSVQVDRLCFRKGGPLLWSSRSAVRAISPFVRDKFTDPPVLVIDEGGSEFLVRPCRRSEPPCKASLPVSGSHPGSLPPRTVNGFFQRPNCVSNGLIIAGQEEVEDMAKGGDGA